jgi:hypothetical protein
MTATPATGDKVRSIYSAPWYGGQVGTVTETYMDGEMTIVRFPNPAQPGTSATVKLPVTVLIPA